jgi:hypothetical protein
MNSPFKASAAIAPTGWYNLAKFSMADDSQAEKVTHWNGLSGDAKKILARDTNDATYLMLALGEEKNYFVRIFAAGNGNATPEVLLKALALEGEENMHVRRAAALNGSATPEVLLKALQHEDPGVRWAAAENRKATPEVLLKALALEGEENVYVRKAAAWNWSATPEVLLKALQNEDPDVRRAVAYNKSATPEFLLKALQDEDPEVRSGAAWNKNATAEVKTKFVLRYYLENGEFPEVDLITPAAISALVRDQRVDLEILGDQIESSPFRNNKFIRASIQLEKKRREKQ